MRTLPKGSALRFATVEEIFENKLLVRLWCFRCFRYEMMSPQAMQRAWRRQLGRLRPRCKHCRLNDQTRALPASDPWFENAGTGNGSARLVERYFHGMREKRRH